MKRFYIETYGCQMNVAESNALEAMFLERGYEKANGPDDCDIAIINTCSVRNSAENRIWGRLGSYTPIKKKKNVILILTGCMAQRLGEEAKKQAPQIDYVVPVNDKLKIFEIIENKDYKNCENYEFTDNYYHEGDFASYVPIMNGCNNFCSYCIVPYVRGRESSRCPEQILNEVKFLDSKNVKEITLLGQNVNSYIFGEMNFPKLLKEICKVCNNIQWIRFESPHPKDFSDELIDVIASEPRVAKHIHIPMQSGNSRILSLMNRHYSREDYLSLIEKIKTEVPGVTFAVDVMVGFPSETEAEFNDTLTAMKEVGYIEAYMYFWNPRHGTRAVTMDGQMPESEKQARLQTLIDYQLKITSEIKENRVGNVQKVLALSVSRDNKNQMLGRNEHNEMVAFDIESEVKPGDIVNVQFISLNGNTFIGRQIV